MSALFRYFTCKTLVTTSTTINNHVIQYSSALRNIVDNKLDSAFVDRTVYPPNKAHTPTSIPMYFGPNLGERDSKRSMMMKTRLMAV
jgi:hypothetical protein